MTQDISDKMVGRKFGNLTVVGRSSKTPTNKFRRIVYTCSCDCGQDICPGTVDVTGFELRQGTVTDCSQEVRRNHPADNYEPPAPLEPGELKSFRERHHWNTRHFSDRTGYSQLRLIHCENGTQEIPKTLNILVRLMQDKERLEAELAVARGET